MKKKELKTALTKSREKLLTSIDGLFDEQMLEPGVSGNWSVKDILFHISMWEAELIRLLWQLHQGEEPSTVQVSGRSVDEVNAEWEELAKTRSLDQVLDDLDGVRRQLLRRLDYFKDPELEDPNCFPALNGKPLWEWIANDTFEHEPEHREQIEAWRKSKGY